MLSTLLHAAGTQTAKTSQFSRRHCLALAAQACTPQGCLHWRAMLEPPLLGKLLGLLGRALRDGDAAVCAAAAEGLGTVAAQLAAAHPGSDLTCEPQGWSSDRECTLLQLGLHACTWNRTHGCRRNTITFQPPPTAAPYTFAALPCTAGTPANPLLACILEALGEPGAGVQASDLLNNV